jgi:lysophospholipid acyltransferase (LPLAT)-like uncharacterized protein
MAALRPHSETLSSPLFHKIGRNRLTRTIDAVLVFVRQYIPPLHWIAIRCLAGSLYVYARAVAATARFVTSGAYRWPEIPPGSVLVFWHGSAPSLLVAFAARKPRAPVKLMVSRDPRGDCVALFCRWLGFETVRGDAEHGGWRALIEIADALNHGAIALIAPDGGGPPCVARAGVAILASVVHAALIPVGANCRPSVMERRKWDAPRNPLPYARVAVVCGEPLHFARFEEAEAIEKSRAELQDALNRAARQARLELGL